MQKLKTETLKDLPLSKFDHAMCSPFYVSTLTVKSMHTVTIWNVHFQSKIPQE